MILARIVSFLFILAFASPMAIGQATPASGSPEFNKLIDAFDELTPLQIKLLRKKLFAAQTAAAERPNGPAIATASTVGTSFRGGKASATVSLITGRLTAIGVYDKFSRPWKIDFLQVSDPSRFQLVQRNNMVNTFTVQPTKEAAEGNLVLYLEGESEPLILTLQTRGKHYHEKYNIQLDGLSLASRDSLAAQTVQNSSPHQNTKYFSFLDGRIPDNAKEVFLSKPLTSETQVWRLDKELIVYTTANIMNPAPTRVVKGIGDSKLYVFSDTDDLIFSNASGELQYVEVLDDER